MHASQTQIDAFNSISPKQKSEAKRTIVAAFGGDLNATMTRSELSAKTKLPVPTICARVNEMVKDGELAERGTAKRPGKRCREGLVGLPVLKVN